MKSLPEQVRSLQGLYLHNSHRRQRCLSTHLSPVPKPKCVIHTVPKMHVVGDLSEIWDLFCITHHPNHESVNQKNNPSWGCFSPTWGCFGVVLVGLFLKTTPKQPQNNPKNPWGCSGVVLGLFFQQQPQKQPHPKHPQNTPKTTP